MSHAVVALHIAVQVGGFWLVVLSLLLYRRYGAAGYLYFGLSFGSTMIMLTAEIASLYWLANAIEPAACWWYVGRATYGVGELLHFFATFRLAWALVRTDVPRWMNTLHLSLLVPYAGAIALLVAAHSTFELQHVTLGSIQIVSIVVILRYRDRIRPPVVRRVVLQVVGVALFFAPMIGISIYSGLAGQLPLGRMTFQVAYALVAEILLTFHVMRNIFVPGRRVTQPECPPAIVVNADLTAREFQIATLVCEGYTNREIAGSVAISERTVTNHLYHIYQKLGVRNRVELMNALTGREPPLAPS